MVARAVSSWRVGDRWPLGLGVGQPKGYPQMSPFLLMSCSPACFDIHSYGIPYFVSDANSDGAVRLLSPRASFGGPLLQQIGWRRYATTI
jgi:hypothetical protein